MTRLLEMLALVRSKAAGLDADELEELAEAVQELGEDLELMADDVKRQANRS